MAIDTYSKVMFQLSPTQMNKLANAYKNKKSVKLRLNKNMASPNEGIPLLLTAREMKKLDDGGSHDINISASRIKEGGFLPALIAAIPAIAAAIGGVAGVTNIAKNIKDMVDKKAGVAKDAKGLYLAPAASGLYLAK